ncbi:uncharacterized protein LOC121406583 [Lytechinus variegatus]|uniref:uncharacterized protein LOC121406583 n=1 Tax=Lytechinus variegatus TaxID=7654 RepID=UPI001BB111A9|nr:uncharacterized protein LOC121406583 [Lytechinus variegatus]
MSTSKKHLHVNSSQVSLNPPEPDRQDEQQSRVKGGDTSVAMLSLVECATVNKGNHDTRDSSTDLIKCGSWTDDFYTDIPTKLTQIPSCVKSQTMKNRPLPDRPKDGLIKPPIPPRKAHTLTRTDQLRNSDTYHKPCTPNDIHSSPTSIRGKTQTTKKAPGGSTPYVKPKSKRYQNNGFPKNKDENNLEEGTGTESRQHLGGNQVPRSSSDVSPSENISDVPRSQTNQDQDKPSFCGEGMNDESNSSRQNAPIVQDVVYCDIEERCPPNTDQVSKGILETEGFNKNEKSSNIQQSCNMYHTLDSTNSNESPVACPEYEGIDNMGRTDSCDFSYDHFNFFNVK